MFYFAILKQGPFHLGLSLLCGREVRRKEGSRHGWIVPRSQISRAARERASGRTTRGDVIRRDRSHKRRESRTAAADADSALISPAEATLLMAEAMGSTWSDEIVDARFGDLPL